MGSNDTYIIDPVLAVQEPENALATKTTPSDGSGGINGSGASSPLSRRHREEVQTSKDTHDVVDVPIGPENNLIDETKVPDKLLSESWTTGFASQELRSALDASMRSSRGDPTPFDSSGGGDGSGTPCPWSLSQEELVRNLKENCRRAGYAHYSGAWADIEDEFARVVANLRVDPYKLEIEGGPTFMHMMSPLHVAVLMGDLVMVQKVLETSIDPNTVHIIGFIGCGKYSVYTISYQGSTGYSNTRNTFILDEKYMWVKYSALDLAIVCGENEIVDALLQKNVMVNTIDIGSLQLAVVSARAEHMENSCKIIQSLVHKGIDINAKDRWGYSAFYLAVVTEKTNVVNELLKWKEKINLNEPCRGGRIPIQIAHEQGFKDIEIALMKCDEVKWFIDAIIREWQGFVDTSNAILVGAAFIASVTFASWLQPPLNYTTLYHHGSSVEYVDVEHNVVLEWFWVFNTLSFYFAIGTVVLGASSVLPRRGVFIIESVKKLSQNLIRTSILLAFSMLFVVVAFGIAGLIVLVPILRYQWYMIVPMILGGIVCACSIGYLFKSLWDHMPWTIRNRKWNTYELDLTKNFYNYDGSIQD